MIQKIANPAAIPAEGSKLIEEYVGRVRTETESVSVARMVAPPGWTEPFQQPQFDEVLIVVRGAIEITHAGGHELIEEGEVAFVGRGERVRYGNPSNEMAEYWAICAPAFGPELVERF